MVKKNAVSSAPFSFEIDETRYRELQQLRRELGNPSLRILIEHALGLLQGTGAVPAKEQKHQLSVRLGPESREILRKHASNGSVSAGEVVRAALALLADNPPASPSQLNSTKDAMAKSSSSGSKKKSAGASKKAAVKASKAAGARKAAKKVSSAAVKQAASKQAPSKKTASKKTAAKKATVRKAPANKTGTKKTVVKKTSAKKTSAKKSATKAARKVTQSAPVKKATSTVRKTVKRVARKVARKRG